MLLSGISTDLRTIDWTAVSAIVATFGVIATTFMVIFTWITLKANNRQLKEMKRQWDEEHKPKIVYNFLTKGIWDDLFLYLKIENIGLTKATNITIDINQEFLETSLLDKERLKKKLSALKNKRLSLNPNDNMLFIIGFISRCERSKIPLELKITYDKGEKIHDIIYTPEIIVDEATSLDIATRLHIKKISESLESISRDIKTIYKE